MLFTFTFRDEIVTATKFDFEIISFVITTLYFYAKTCQLLTVAAITTGSVLRKVLRKSSVFS